MGTDVVLWREERTPAQERAAEKNLVKAKPFTSGDSRQRKGTGRPSRLDDPEYVEQFGKAVAMGLDTKELSLVFNVPERTVRQHKRDPRVVAVAKKFVEERVLGVVRKTDSEIETRLRQAKNMTTKELLEIRKEFLGGVFRQETEGGREDPDTITSAQSAIEANPELGVKLAEFIQELADEKEKVPA